MPLPTHDVPYTTKQSRGKTFAVFADLTQLRMFSRKYFLSSFSQIISHQAVAYFLVVQIMALESFAHIVNSKPYERANKEAPGESIGNRYET